MKNTAPSYPITEPVTTTLDLGIPDAFCSNHATISTVRALHQQAAEKQKPNGPLPEANGECTERGPFAVSN